MSVMAGQDRTVQVNLNADVSGYQRAIQDAGRVTDALLSSITKVAKATDDLIKRAGRKMVLLGTGDLAALTGAAEAFNRLDTSMSSIRATSAITGQNVGQIRTQILGLSRVIPDSTNNIARLVGQVQALGIQGTQNIKNFTETAERLAAATDTPPGQLLTGIIQMNREMGTGLASVNRYSSALIELSKQNGVAAGDIMGFAQSIRSVAQQSGYTETQIMGLATAFTRAGADSAAAANVFVSLTSQINQSIVANSAQLNQFASLVGMTRDQFKSLAQSHPEQAFTRVIEAIQGQGQRGILTLQQLGLDGPRALRVIASLTSGQANMTQAMNQASDAYSRNQALTKASNASWHDLSSTMQTLRNDLNQVAIAFGGPIAHVLNIFFEGISKVLGVVDQFLALLGPIPGIVAGIGGAFLAVTGIITTFSVAILALAGAWRAMSGMTGSNIMQGFFSGRRAPQGTQATAAQYAQTIFGHRPIDMAKRSGAARWWYGNSYWLGQRTAAPPPEDPNFLQRLGAATGRGALKTLTFPFRKVGWEAREALDTIRHPFNYENRNAGAVNPASMLGFFQSANNGRLAVGGALGRTRDSVSDAIMAAGQRVSQFRIPGADLRTQVAKAEEPLTYRVKADVSQAETEIKTVRAAASAPVVIPVRISDQAVRGVSSIEGGSNVPANLAQAVQSMAGGGAAKEAENLAESGPGLLSRAAGVAGKSLGVVTGALGSMADVVGSVVGPLGLMAAVGIPLYQEMTHLSNAGRDAANHLDDLGAGIALAAGGSYTKPTGSGQQNQTPADKTKAWGSNEVQTALSGSFAATTANSKTIQRFQDYNKAPKAARVAIAQQAVNEIVQNANSGQALSTSQQQTLREALIAAYNGDVGKAQAVYNQLNLAGQTGQAAAQTTATTAKYVTDDSNWLEGAFQGNRSARQLRTAAEPIANALMSGNFGQAGLGLIALSKATVGTGPSAKEQAQATITRLMQTGKQRQLTPAEQTQLFQAQNVVAGHGYQATTPGQQKFQVAAQSILDQYNKGKDHADQVRGVQTDSIHSLQDFIDAVQKSGNAGKDLVAALKSVGFNADGTAASLNALKAAADHNTSLQIANQINATRIGSLATGLGINLANPQDVGYQTNMNLLTQLAMAGVHPGKQGVAPVGAGGQPGDIQAALMTNQDALVRGIKFWQQYRQNLPGPDDPAYAGATQAIQTLTTKLQQQQQIFMQPWQMAGTSISMAQNILNTASPSQLAGAQGAEAQNWLDQAQGQIATSENQLRQYLLQVHQAHIDSQHEEHDHNLQLSRMWRDYNRQQAEALYQRNLQVREANYQFGEQLRQMRFQTADAFGNPAQMVQAQYTFGASSALIGMKQQVDLLRRSKQAMDQLANMGLSKGAIRLLGLDDPKNVDQAERYVQDLAANPRLVQAFNKSIKNRLKISEGINTDVNNSKFADMKRQFDHTATLATNAFNHSQQLTARAFQTSISDFNTDYETAVTRQQQQLNQLGQNLYTSLASLNNAAMNSNLANIKTFAKGVEKEIHRVSKAETHLVNQGYDFNNQGTNPAGSGATGSGYITGVPGGPGRVAGMHRVQSGVNSGFLLSAVSQPGTDVNQMGNPLPQWGTNVKKAPDDKKLPSNAKLAKSMAAPYGWGDGAEWAALYQLWSRESANTWSPTVGVNAPGHAYGIPEAFWGKDANGVYPPANPMSRMGSGWATDPKKQIEWGLEYITTRYGDPLGAWAHEARTGWYQKGGVFGSAQVIGVGEGGPEAVLPLNSTGASFVATVVGQVIRNTGINGSMVRLTHTLPRASVVFNAPINNHSDYSTNFTGDITVQAQDPNQMAQKLEQRQRLARLTRPRR